MDGDAILKKSPDEDISTAGIGLVVMEDTGVVYTNQAGGYACRQPRAEGYFVPLCELFHDKDHTAKTLQKELDDHFFGGGANANPNLSIEEIRAGKQWEGNTSKYKGHCYDGIDDATCDFLDKLFVAYGIEARTDRLAKEDAIEAWVPVIYKGKEAFFVWENSD